MKVKVVPGLFRVTVGISSHVFKIVDVNCVADFIICIADKMRLGWYFCNGEDSKSCFSSISPHMDSL